MRVFLISGDVWEPPEGYGVTPSSRGFDIKSPTVLEVDCIQFTSSPEVVADAPFYDIPGNVAWKNMRMGLSGPATTRPL